MNPSPRILNRFFTVFVLNSIRTYIPRYKEPDHVCNYVTQMLTCTSQFESNVHICENSNQVYTYMTIQIECTHAWQFKSNLHNSIQMYKYVYIKLIRYPALHLPRFNQYKITKIEFSCKIQRRMNPCLQKLVQQLQLRIKNVIVSLTKRLTYITSDKNTAFSL